MLGLPRSCHSLGQMWNVRRAGGFREKHMQNTSKRLFHCSPRPLCHFTRCAASDCRGSDTYHAATLLGRSSRAWRADNRGGRRQLGRRKTERFGVGTSMATVGGTSARHPCKMCTKEGWVTMLCSSPALHKGGRGTLPQPPLP